MEVVIATLLSAIVSTVISIRITADAMRNFEKHLNEMCDINVEQCSRMKDITLSNIEELIKKTSFDK